MRTRHLLLFFLIGFVTLPGMAPAQKEGMTKVPVIGRAEKHMFPCRWNNKKIHAEAVLLTAEEMPVVKAVISRALAKYPAWMAERYLKKVYVLKSIRFYGYPYGGTYIRKILYLTYDGDNPLTNGQVLEERFHHEWSSILWKENLRKLNLDQWVLFNARGFTYGEGGIDAIREGLTSMETDPGYFNIGFLNRYAMTEIEQDINVMAQYLFTGGPAFWKIVDTNALIRGKATLLINFYHSLDPMFTEDYFRNLR